MAVYYISPHFDDAIGSCGGKIYLDYLAQKNPHIITIFGEVKEPFSKYATDLHKYWDIKDPFRERKEENKNACAIIKAKNISLKYCDAIYRIYNNKHMYSIDGSIFKEIHVADKDLYLDISNDLLKLVTKKDKLYFPLGIGNHVDHIIVNKVGQYLKEKGYKVEYYADFSYEGTIPKKYKKIEVIKLPKDILMKKALAMSKYTSQINMLFGSEDKILDYYQDKLKGGEEYYE